jgi:hypothetical protein
MHNTPAAWLPSRHALHCVHGNLQARGIVVDGVIASPQTRWRSIVGRQWLPPSTIPAVPAVMEVAMLPLYWLYCLIGPQLAWRMNNHPVFLDGPNTSFIVGNALVWGQLALLVLFAMAARALARHAKLPGKRRAAQKRKAE